MLKSDQNKYISNIHYLYDSKYICWPILGSVLLIYENYYFYTFIVICSSSYYKKVSEITDRKYFFMGKREFLAKIWPKWSIFVIFRHIVFTPKKIRFSTNLKLFFIRILYIKKSQKSQINYIFFRVKREFLAKLWSKIIDFWDF